MSKVLPPSRYALTVFSTEYDYCSNRGICDFNAGNCICFPGFGGVACNEWIEPSLNQPGVRGTVSREVCSRPLSLLLTLFLSLDQRRGPLFFLDCFPNLNREVIRP